MAIHKVCEICGKIIEMQNEKLYLIDGYMMCDDCRWMSEFGMEKEEKEIKSNINK